MTTLSVGQLFDNGAPKTFQGSVANNTEQAVWTPASGKTVRARAFSVTTDENTTPFRVEILEDTTVVASYYILATAPVYVAIPGEGWLLSGADKALQVHHQAGTSRNLAVAVWGREE
ncbi:MAG: hypothetical protein L0177_11855 [Chloroflexi bacterium]|nr:hypothetical protein [Chloroflexota bacterium]